MYTVTLRINNSLVRLDAMADEVLLSVLLRNGVQMSSCGGGSCGKCRVRLISGTVSGEAVTGGIVRACRAHIESDIQIAPLSSPSFVAAVKKSTPPQNSSEAVNLGVAVDVGSTTLVARLCDLSSGEVIAEASAKNPQAVFGSDVISRISASKEHMDELSASLLYAISSLIKNLCSPSLPERVVISGNTVMQYFLLGRDTAPLGAYPLPVISHHPPTLPPEALGLGENTEIIIIPPISAFVGGDIVSGMLSLDFDKRTEKVALLCDIGTNGELALLCDGKIKVASAAAGPAFEGGGIECGMAFGVGAIDSVKIKSGELSFTVVGGSTPLGICGSGLVDTVAALLDCGALLCTGAFAPRSTLPPTLAPRLRDGRFYLTGEIYLSSEDVRAFILARAAISTAISLLCDTVKPDVIYLSGAFGKAASTDSLTATSVLPSGIPIVSLSNSSLDGAVAVLLDSTAIGLATELAELAQCVELSMLDGFESAFLANLKL